jgi:hypothetical protein
MRTAFLYSVTAIEEQYCPPLCRVINDELQQGKNGSVMEVTLFSTRYSPLRCRLRYSALLLLISVSPYPCFMAIEQVHPKTKKTRDLCGFDWFRF